MLSILNRSLKYFIQVPLQTSKGTTYEILYLCTLCALIVLQALKCAIYAVNLKSKFWNTSQVQLKQQE